MPLNRLAAITVGVPDVGTTSHYYTDFGLTEVRPGEFATVDGGVQLVLQQAPTRRLLGVDMNVDDVDDLRRVARNLDRLSVPSSLTEDSLTAIEPATGVRVKLRVGSPLALPPSMATPLNGPGRVERANVRAPVLLRTESVRPRKLGHVVIGSVDAETTRGFFIDGIGLKVTDQIGDRAAFMRCSTDHHNVLVQSSPVSFMHHTAWEVDDIDEVGRGATAMLAKDPTRHVWGLGRHHIGSNFFWYLKDPAGNFSEYYSDMDEILDDQLWHPEVFENGQLNSWGPERPPSFVRPEDLAELMADVHSAR